MVEIYNYSYEEYLNAQKAHVSTAKRTKVRNRIADFEHIRSIFGFENLKVLCVGCRDYSELADFKTNNFQPVGIDLYSTHSEIQICDMHKLDEKFSENEFDFAYLSHVLEHSYNPHIVLQSLRKITKKGLYIILPLLKEPTPKDPCVFSIMKSVSSLEAIQNEFNFFLNNFEVALLDIKRKTPEFAFILKWKS